MFLLGLGSHMLQRPSPPQQPPSWDESELETSRRAHWLQSAYPSPIWTVADSLDPLKTATINFAFRLADGRLLTEVPRMYATVKEYAWWIRDPRFSRIDDSATQRSMVYNLMNIAHSLSYNKIASFGHLQPYDIERLVEMCRYGTDHVLCASERVSAHLLALAEANAANPMPFGGLPEYVVPSTGTRTKRLHVEQVMADCNLPAGAGQLPSVAALLRKASTENGFFARTTRTHVAVESEKRCVTTQALQRWLDPLEQLYAMRRHLQAESVSFRPFALGAARVAAVKGSRSARTATAPPRLALHLLEQSAKWVIERDQTHQCNLADRRDVQNTATACWILIAAFSARRDEEINGLRNECLRGDDVAGWWLDAFIEKTLQRREWIPIPALVAKAVQVLRYISASARLKTGTSELFQWEAPDGRVATIEVGRYLDDFSKLVGVPTYKARDGKGEPWHWHPHQFRRFFAVLYFYRFDGASIEALSHHLRRR